MVCLVRTEAGVLRRLSSAFSNGGSSMIFKGLPQDQPEMMLNKSLASQE